MGKFWNWFIIGAGLGVFLVFAILPLAWSNHGALANLWFVKILYFPIIFWNQNFGSGTFGTSTFIFSGIAYGLIFGILGSLFGGEK